MGLEINKFRKFNNLIKNKRFLNAIVKNVANQLELIKKKKNNSVILNYDEKSTDLFNWYQQLMAESLGKNNTGILPIISCMPKDNHSVMQFYLDGPKNYFFTFFMVKEKYSQKLSSKNIFNSHDYLKDKSLRDILLSQFTATQKVFKKKKIPYRTFVINNRSEEALGELFTFFILEVILLGKFMKNNPFNQPAVELIKKETNKLLI
jgi:glucose-6-phosphate isomerase